jgi:hypothetical protein
VRELGQSFVELLRRASARAIFVVSGLAAAAVAFVEHVWPKTHIADVLWLWLFVVGFAVGLLAAFHEVRVERDDRGSAELVPPNHGEALRSYLQSLTLALANGHQWDPSEEVDAHFSDLMPRLREWNAAVERVVHASEALATAALSEASILGVTAEQYEMQFVLDYVDRTVREAAAENRLDQPAPAIAWAYVQDADKLLIEIAHQQPPVASIYFSGQLSTEIGDNVAVRTITSRVERFLSRTWGSSEASDLAAAQSAAAELRASFRPVVVRRSQAERIFVATGCPICQLNLG